MSRDISKFIFAIARPVQSDRQTFRQRFLHEQAPGLLLAIEPAPAALPLYTSEHVLRV